MGFFRVRCVNYRERNACTMVESTTASMGLAPIKVGGGFTKMLFRRRFTYCAMVIPFILHSFPCSSLFLSKARISPKVTIACNGFCLLRHTKTRLARDIISYSCMMFARVLACTLVNFEIIALDN